MNGNDPTPVAALLAELLLVSKSILQSVNTAMKTTGLTLPRHEVLALVAREPDGQASTAHLYRGLDRHPTTIGTLVDGLVDTGMLTRDVNPDDRREVVVRITERGASALLRASRAVDAVYGADSEVLRRAVDTLRAVHAGTGPVQVGS